MTDWSEHYLIAKAALKETEEALRFGKNVAAGYAAQRAIEALEKIRQFAEEDASKAI